MKINKSFCVSVVGVNILPIVGYLYSLLKINRHNAKWLLIPVCLFNFFLALKAPPYQDMYRRYLQTYYGYAQNTTLWDAIDNKIDYLFYTNAWVFYKLNIPFFIIPAMYASLTVYYIYMAYLKSGMQSNSDISNYNFKLSSIIIISFVNVVAIATTLRFGFAASMAVYGLVCLYLSGEKTKGRIFLLIAMMMHISMLIIICSTILARFVKLNRILTIFGCIFFCLFSSVLIRFLLLKFNFFGLNNYFLTGYVESAWGGFRTELSTLFFLFVQYTILLFLFVSTMKKTKYLSNDKFDNFLNVLLVVCFSLTISITVFNRFFDNDNNVSIVDKIFYE
ncbi:EpsG family protein [Klebsiella quasipneumoniae]|uniref:EpsG family protein n=1 Tax=Klebsiella quasipneumoniae TaxID=1463165 RepID=UPI00388CFD04